jgi:hypothetical protein
MNDFEEEMKDLEFELDEALIRCNTQGAKDIILGASDILLYGAVYTFYENAWLLAAKRGDFYLLEFLMPYVTDYNDDMDEDFERELRYELFVSAFDAAREGGQSDTAYLLVVNYEDTFGNFVAEQVSEHCIEGDLKSVKYFFDTFSLSIEDHQDLIFDAATSGNLPIVKYLLEKGAEGRQPHPFTKKCLGVYVEDHLTELDRRVKSGELSLGSDIRKVSEIHDYLLEFYPECFV